MAGKPPYDEQEQGGKFLESQMIESAGPAQDLAQQTAFLSSVFDAIQDGIAVLDRDLNVVWVNKWMETKYPTEMPLVGKRCHSVFQERQEPCDDCPCIPTLATGKPNTQIVPYPSAQNPSGWLELSAFSLEDTEGNVTGVIEHIKDVTHYKRVEEELAKSQNRFKALTERTSDWIWEIDKDAVYTYVNPKVFDMLGYPPEEVIGKRPIDFMPKEEADRVAALFSKIVESREPFEGLENTNLHKDGRSLVFETSGVPILDSSGELIGYRGIDRDVTERKRAQGRIEDLNLLNQELLTAASIEEKLKWVTEAVVRIFEASFCRIWITKPGDLCELDCAHADVKEGPHICHFRDRCLHLMASSGAYSHLDGGHRRVPFGAYKIGRVASGEDADFITNDVVNDPRVHDHDWARQAALVSFAGYRLIAKGGEPIGVMALFSKNPITSDEHALLKGVASVTAQVIQTATAQETLRESQENLTDLFENLEDLLFIIDVAGRIIHANPVVSKRLGYSIEELAGLSIPELHPPDRREEAAQIMAAMLAGEALDCPIPLMSKDGTLIQVETKVTQGKWSGQDVLFGISRDITERKRMQEELLKVHKLESVGILAGGIAHDFNNLLSVIMGSVELARDDFHPDHRIAILLNRAMKASSQAQELTNQLITFSKGGAPVKTVGSISDLVRGTASYAVTQLKARVSFSSSTDLWPVEFDEGQMIHAFRQLIVNALEAMPGGGQIELKAENFSLSSDIAEPSLPLSAGRYVKISVGDQGVGIPEENLGKVFDPYFSTKEMGAQKGLGLGLTTAYSIVTRHNGYLLAESEVGIGTTFMIFLPAHEEAMAEAEPAAQTEPEGPRGYEGKILLMDDEELMRDLGKEMLAIFGYEVSLARDGGEAIELYRDSVDSGQPFDAVILDLSVKRGMGGREAAKEIMGMNLHAKVIVSSGYSDDPVMTDYRTYGFMGALPKPYSKKDLGELLDKL